MLHLGPREFCRLTNRQFDLLMDAAVEQQRDERRFTAAMTANQMNCWIDKRHRITGAELLGERPRKAQQQQRSFAEMSELERAAALDAINNRAVKKAKRGKQARTKTKAVR